jgi:peptidoglycan hydrolase CwlO-like protein
MPKTCHRQEPQTKQLEELAARLDQLIAKAEATVRKTFDEIAQLEKDAASHRAKAADEDLGQSADF